MRKEYVMEYDIYGWPTIQERPEDPLRYRLKTKVIDGVIKQELQCPPKRDTDQLMCWIMDTRERDTINALIDLGWTPPKGKGLDNSCKTDIK
jgi:type II secretory pathway component PulJ